MANKLIFISPDDRTRERVLQRDSDAAFDELRWCITDFNACLESLARKYPGTAAIGTFVGGKSQGAMVLAGSGEGDLCSSVALERMRTLARFVGNLSQELLRAFEIEFNLTREKRRIEAHIAAIKRGEEPAPEAG